MELRVSVETRYHGVEVEDAGHGHVCEKGLCVVQIAALVLSTEG